KTKLLIRERVIANVQTLPRRDKSSGSDRHQQMSHERARTVGQCQQRHWARRRDELPFASLQVADDTRARSSDDVGAVALQLSDLLIEHAQSRAQLILAVCDLRRQQLEVGAS